MYFLESNEIHNPCPNFSLKYLRYTALPWTNSLLKIYQMPTKNYLKMYKVIFPQ